MAACRMCKRVAGVGSRAVQCPECGDSFKLCKDCFSTLNDDQKRELARLLCESRRLKMVRLCFLGLGKS